MPVDSTQDTTDASGTDDATTGPRRRWSTGRIAVTATVGLLLAMWVYVLYLAFGPGRQPPADRLDDPAFAQAGEERCAMALAGVDALPVAPGSPTPAERAEVIESANGMLTVMLDDLDGMAAELVPAGDQLHRAEEWLADWRVLLNDRVDYAAALRSDPDARLLISEKENTGRHITGWIDEFAKANNMPSCVTPSDV